MTARPLIIGHRGAKGLAPENSPAGFQHAVDLGVDGVEFDIHPTRDGDIAVIHDAALGRTTSARGPVTEHTAAELRSIRMKKGGETVPMLADVLALLAPTQLLINVEIKAGARRRPYPGLPAVLARMLAAQGMMDRAVISSFDWEVVTEFLAHARPRLTLGLANRRHLREHGGIGSALAHAREHGFDGICTVAAALRRPRPPGDGVLWVYESNDVPTLRRAIDSDVDAIITDRPDIALRLRDGD